MPFRRIPAVFMRGGTSKALVFRAADLPADRAAWDAIFLAAMGVPDPNGRQLDGMGGGLSSLNKVCVVGPPSRPDADVDYTFVQLGIDDPLPDYGGNCGNMSSAIGPFAVEEGLVPAPADGEAAVRIHNTNTGKIIVARFPVVDGALAPEGDLALDGVAGTAAPIKLEFLDPGGAKTGRLLPTGSPVDTLDAAGFGPVRASCVDAANPCVFVAATDLGLTGAELPTVLERDPVFLASMEAIRQAASVAMGLAPDLAAATRLASIPKVAIVAAPGASPTLSSRTLAADEMDIAVRMISVGQPHRAVPITGAVCLAVAARVAGSIPQQLCASAEGPIRIGHASGTILVDAAMRDGKALNGAVFRTARRLFEGNVIYRAP
jgi:2-methylaconitate isomerase